MIGRQYYPRFVANQRASTYRDRSRLDAPTSYLISSALVLGLLEPEENTVNNPSTASRRGSLAVIYDTLQTTVRLQLYFHLPLIKQGQRCNNECRFAALIRRSIRNHRGDPTYEFGYMHQQKESAANHSHLDRLSPGSVQTKYQ